MKSLTKHICLSWLICLIYAFPCAAVEEDSVLESYNRGMFAVNAVFDHYIIKPLAKGYRSITNNFIRQRVRNFYENLKEPASMINHTLQGNVSESGKSVGRFAVNSTLGLLGTFDVASGWGLDKNKTGFDHTLAKWCVPDGPFVILPLIGPSTPRAAVGMAADTAADPSFWSSYYTSFSKDWEKYSFYYGITALGFISLREQNIEFLDKLTANSVDQYSTIKSAYMQNRLKLGACDTTNDTVENNYDFDFDDFDDE